MKRHLKPETNHSLRRKRQQTNPAPSNYGCLTTLISIVAISISCLTLYYQFFYEKHELIASIVDGEFEGDSILVTNVIYHNKGTQHGTIVQNTIYFHQNSSDIENKGFHFTPSAPKICYKDDFDPVVLLPGQQLYKSIVQPFRLNRIDYKSFNMDPGEPIKISLLVGYINDKGTRTAEFIPMGWVKIDTTHRITSWNIDFTSKTLESDSHYVNRHTISERGLK
jgi:hypothetical protein